MTTNGYDNQQVPGITSEAYYPDQLVAGVYPRVTDTITVTGGAKLARGTVLGQVTEGAVSAVAGANTGNGTVGSMSTGTYPLAGAYKLTATGANTFHVADPNGLALPDATVGTPYANPHLNFTITAGGTAFVAGDTFTLTIAAGSGKFKPCVATATDGSEVPVAVLADIVDASAGDVTGPIYRTGEFNGNALTIDASWSLSALTTALAKVSIFVKSSVSAADPN